MIDVICRSLLFGIMFGEVCIANAFAWSPTQKLQYMASDSTGRTAQLDTVDQYWDIPGISCHSNNPNWLVQNPNGAIASVAQILILATDGNTLKVSVESHCSPSQISFTLKYERLDNSNQHESETMQMRRPDNTFMDVGVIAMNKTWPGHPTFNVSNLP